KAADCSGFVQNVYFRNGIILSRDASLQALHGENIDISGSFDSLQKGDLLFFGTMRDSVPRVTHVAIYKGNGEYIHSSGMVRVNSLDTARADFSNTRRSSLLLARRIIGNVSTEGITAVKNHQLY
ncbi:MAG: C40 family peptidase, partial [Bacteroidales bacterium]|nr:C40 family peptidase [Bacteroidales bacterium]